VAMLTRSLANCSIVLDAQANWLLRLLCLNRRARYREAERNEVAMMQGVEISGRPGVVRYLESPCARDGTGGIC
jgi:hypothetical protein